MRILLGWAWTYLIVAEVVGTMSGITLFISRSSGRYLHYEYVYAAIAMIGIIRSLTTDMTLAWLAGFALSVEAPAFEIPAAGSHHDASGRRPGGSDGERRQHPGFQGLISHVARPSPSAGLPGKEPRGRRPLQEDQPASRRAGRPRPAQEL